MSAVVRFFLPGGHERQASVEVYDDDLVLRARTPASRAAELAPGRYHAVARLAHGGRLTRSVTLVEGADVEVVFAGGAGPGEAEVVREAWQHGPFDVEGSLMHGDSPVLEGWKIAGAEPPQSDVLLLDFGYDDHGEWRLVQTPLARLWPGASQKGSEEHGVGLALFSSLADAQWCVLPAMALGSVIPATAGGAGAQRLAPRLEHQVADAIMAFINRGQVLDAAVLGGDIAAQAERLLYRKSADPVAAAAGAMALLSIGDLDRLHDWTTNLATWFPWLPDGQVALAEHQALLGRHDVAARLLRSLRDVGVPVLTVALMAAVDRLGSYTRTRLADDELRATHEHLMRYAIACDLTATITTFAAAKGPEQPQPRSRTGDGGR